MCITFITRVSCEVTGMFSIGMIVVTKQWYEKSHDMPGRRWTHEVTDGVVGIAIKLFSKSLLRPISLLECLSSTAFFSRLLTYTKNTIWLCYSCKEH